MKKIVVGLLGAAALTAASAANGQVVSLGTPSGDLGPTEVYSTARGNVIASGFNGASTSDLYGKNAGPGEVGLGLGADPSGQNEISATPSYFVQLDVSGLDAGTILSFLMNSTTAGEVWQVRATNSADCYLCGSVVASGTDELWHSLGLPTNTYYDFYASGTSGGAPSNVLLSSLSVAAVPEASTWAMMLLGFGAIGFAMRRRRSGAIAQLA